MLPSALCCGLHAYYDCSAERKHGNKRNRARLSRVVICAHVEASVSGKACPVRQHCAMKNENRINKITSKNFDKPSQFVQETQLHSRVTVVSSG